MAELPKFIVVNGVRYRLTFLKCHGCGRGMIGPGTRGWCLGCVRRWGIN